MPSYYIRSPCNLQFIELALENIEELGEEKLCIIPMQRKT